MAAPNPSPIGQTVYSRVAAVGEPDTYPLSALTVSP
jgi:hypothetical protein